MTQKLIKPDVCVIGAGSGGLSVAAGAAQMGLSVVLFEKAEMGGDCLNFGCVPSKALISAGKAAQAARTSARFGIANHEPLIHWAGVKTHVQGVIATIAPVDSQERFEKLGCTVIREHAKFTDPNTVESPSARVRARRIVIATGSRAVVPRIPGLDQTPYLTNETIFSIQDQPRHLIILGAGPIGIELGQAFRRLGSQVTILEAGRALAKAEPEAASVAIQALRAEGVTILENTKATAVSGQAGAISVATDTGQAVAGTHLLVAVGRSPVLEGLDLEAGRVSHDAKGVHTKPTLRSVSNPRVWAVGDANGRSFFTHAAGWHASVWVRNALFKTGTKVDSLPVPAVTYCEPELAQVGLTAAQAEQLLGTPNVRVVRWSFEENDRAQAEASHEGFAQIVTDAKGTILGACIVGDNAGDIIQQITLAMSNKLKIRALTNVIAPYPTRGEIVKRVAGQWYVPTLFSPRTKFLVALLQKIP
ncbi:MAG: dihydrolipoyl dehydrogenase family protein [Caulobacterales bacterium]